MFRFVRSLVSRDKVRYQDGTHDLDLTYITDRVVGITPPIKPNFAAMSFPATGVESTWRNYIRDVAHFLNERHGNNYRVYNLSERNYEKECFTGQVAVDSFSSPLSFHSFHSFKNILITIAII